MKANLTKRPNYFLTLVPETKDEETIIQEFVTTIGTGKMITSRGYKYMAKEIEFQIQQTYRND